MSGAPSLSAIAIHAYVYSYPLVLADTHRLVTTNRPARGGRGLAAPDNTLARSIAVEEAGDFSIAMTTNTIGWLDLRDGPARLHVPETRRRFAFLTLFDGFGNAFASLGTREDGSREREYLVYGPGRAPSDAGKGVVEAPGFRVFVLARTWPTVNDERGPRSRRFYASTDHDYTPERDPMVDTRVGARTIVERMSADEYWKLTASLLALHPAPRQDWKVLVALAALGIRPGQPIDVTTPDELTRGALRRALPLGLSQITSTADHLAYGGRTEPEDPYLERAARAQLGFARERAEDILETICSRDAAGEVLSGTRSYDLELPAGASPKTNAFWTIDVYDVQHPRNLPSHSVHGPSLEQEADGSIRIAMGADAAERAANAFENLPPQFIVVFRTYMPAFSMLESPWQAPPPQAADAEANNAVERL